MKPLLLFLAISLPVLVLSQSEPAKPSDESAAAAEARRNDPPTPDGSVAGRYQVVMLHPEGGSHLALRVDTFSGETWTLQHSIGESKQADSKAETAVSVNHVDYWKRCLEPAAMDSIKRPEHAPSASPKAGE